MSMPSDQTITTEARYGDGRSAASRTVEVSLGADGLVLKQPGTEVNWQWPYAEIEAATPLDVSSREALLRRKWRGGPASPPDQAQPGDDGGATLFITNREFVQALLGRATGLTTRSERWRYAKPGLLIMLAATVATIVIYVTNISPSKAVAELVPVKTWEAVGTQMLAGLAKGHRECSNEPGRMALDKLMRRIVTGDYESQGYRAKVVEWDLLNAFAMPGRRIILTSKLIETAGSGEEIAGVLAHEVGHGLERHPETAIVRIVGLATLAKMMASGIGDTFSNSSLMLLQLRYNRDAEREADQRAAELLRAAGIAVKPLALFLKRMKKVDGDVGAEPFGGILSTHPGIDERVKSIENLPAYPTTPALSPADLAALRAICKK
ncbi:MAG: M48 family metallopeptidase [Hyphomicrobiaceae bacterium]